jgi:hypothetical protein
MWPCIGRRQQLACSAFNVTDHGLGMPDLMAVYAHSSHVLTLVVRNNFMGLGCAAALATT